MTQQTRRGFGDKDSTRGTELSNNASHRIINSDGLPNGEDERWAQGEKQRKGTGEVMSELKILVMYHAEKVQFSDANIQTIKVVLQGFLDYLDAQTEVKAQLNRDRLWFEPHITVGKGSGAILQVGVYVPDDPTGARFTDQLRSMAISRGL